MRYAMLVILAPLTWLAAQPVPNPGVAVILEDDAAGLLKLLTNPTGDSGEGHVENRIVFAGKEAIKIVPMQRFSPRIPGWKYRIVEKPAEGEFRYLRFAWKADGCAGIMVQLHDLADWRIRYTAGLDQYGWGTKFVADKPPTEWAVVTVDLWKDFGDRAITGIALTVHGGTAGYFDHIYFGRTLGELDRIDATGYRANPPKNLTDAELVRLCSDLGHTDAAKSYQAFWQLVAVPKLAVPALQTRLAAGAVGVDARKVKQWILELDHEEFETREAAQANLAKHLEAAAALLEMARTTSPSAEVRQRATTLLAGVKVNAGERERLERGVRVLEYTASRQALTELAKGPEGSRVVVLAQAALKRLEPEVPRK